MPPSSISNATRMASWAAASSTLPRSRAASLPPHAGHMPYGKAKPSLTLPQSSQRHWSVEPAQQTYASSPSTGRWHFGQVAPGVSSAPATAEAPAKRAPSGSGAIGLNAATSSLVSGHFLPLERYVAMDLAA